MEPISSVGHDSLLQKGIKRGDLALEKHLKIARGQLAISGKGQINTAKEGNESEGAAYQ